MVLAAPEGKETSWECMVGPTGFAPAGLSTPHLPKCLPAAAASAPGAHPTSSAVPGVSAGGQPAGEWDRGIPPVQGRGFEGLSQSKKLHKSLLEETSQRIREVQRLCFTC